ncbi:MAG: hypothetical protein ACXWOL_05815 [Ktedonobacteraceae bacterium]
MGILVSQLPPAELARLKAELAETLISNFCYPRFYDYRIDSLRMRPVDRSKRQEVWQYLGSVDFNAWGRIDLMSPDFQRQVERLLIYFVQRNRTFFGDQGRKRMADIRLLISASSTSIVEGLRGHLTGKSNGFGNPRPTNSWANSNITKRNDPPWEQLVAPTMLLQHQIQEARGELKATQNEMRPNGASSSKHSMRERSNANGHSNGVTEHELPLDKHVSTNDRLVEVEQQTFPDTDQSKITNPLTSPDAIEAQPVSDNKSVDELLNQKDQVLISKGEAAALHLEQDNVIANTTFTPQKQSLEPLQDSISAPAILQSQELGQATPPSQTEVTIKEHANATVLVSEEDVVIFQQMRHQLVVWARIEAVRTGLDIASHEPSELLDMLQQIDGIDQTRLQVTSTLINLCDQIIAAGQASLLEYKQAIMFYLMHTRSFR